MFRFSDFFRRYSTLSTAIHETYGDRKPTNVIVDYLSDSLRFSKKDAISISLKGKLTHLKSTAKSELVVNTLKIYGLNNTQIKNIISYAPKILACKPDTTIQPKLKVFQELGLSGSDLVCLIRRNPELFGYGLHTRIIPGIDLLKKVMGSDENVIQVIKKSEWLYCTNSSMTRISTNVSILQNFGLSNERIVKFVLGNPKKILANPKLLEHKLSYVEEKFELSRDLPSFIYALSVVLYIDDKEIEKKMQCFRSFGWDDSDIALLFRSQPYCFNKSEGNIREKLEYFMKELRYTPLYLMSCNSFFTFSLKKRVIPRNMMLDILKEKKLFSDKPSLITIVSYKEPKFIEFLRGFENDIPCLSEIYMDSIKRLS